MSVDNGERYNISPDGRLEPMTNTKVWVASSFEDLGEL